MIKWLGENWFKILIILVFIIGVVIVYQSCGDSADQKKMDANDKEIKELEKKNTKLEGEMYEAVEKAKAAEKVVAEKEAEIAKSAFKIKEPQKRRIEIVRAVAELPAPRLVEDLREILDCAQIELKDDGVLFPMECSRTVLAMAREFSLIKEELKETQFSLSASLEATQFQKMATWYFLGAAWKMGGQILNYKVIIKKKDENFSLLKKQKKRSWLNGATKGFLAGVGLTIIFILARGR